MCSATTAPTLLAAETPPRLRRENSSLSRYRRHSTHYQNISDAQLVQLHEHVGLESISEKTP
eukprot:5091024-Pyramimonas_sp.AAC.1